MKNSAVLLILLFVANIVFAQERTIEKSFTVNEDQKVSVDLKFGETITINAWDKNEVSFRAVVNINNGKLNNALELDYDEANGSLSIASNLNKDKLKSGRAKDCPQRSSKYSWSGDGEGSYVVCSDIIYELMIPRNADLEVESISGDIELVGLHGSVRAKSISGFVDLSWPSGKSADIEMKTISGEAFTDIDELQFKNKKDHIPIVGYEVKGQIGSGGPIVSLESISGNIYLRKKNF